MADSLKLNIYDFLNRRLDEMVEKTHAPAVSFLGRHIFFYGDIFGNRSPIADATMTGSIIGLTSDRTVNGLALYYYAAMEFIALQTRQIIEVMNSSGHGIKSIFMSGSLCQNDILMSLLSTVCNMPVFIPEYVHAAVVHGAAMLGIKAASANEQGKTEDLWSIMNRMSKPGRVVKPRTDKKEQALLEVKYKVFGEMCRQQREFRAQVDEAIEGWSK
jgi:ribulose kinase